MKLKTNINFLEKYIAHFVIDIEYKRIRKKLEEYVLILFNKYRNSHILSLFLYIS